MIGIVVLLLTVLVGFDVNRLDRKLWHLLRPEETSWFAVGNPLRWLSDERWVPEALPILVKIRKRILISLVAQVEAVSGNEAGSSR